MWSMSKGGKRKKRLNYHLLAQRLYSQDEEARTVDQYAKGDFLFVKL